MKTIEEVLEMYKSNTLDGRDIYRLVDFIPEEKLGVFDMELKEEFSGKHKEIPLTREAVLERLEDDVAFGFEKALNKRGMSASLMHDVVRMWNWILEEGLEDFEEYTQYGLPLFKATAVKYGFNNPIGDDEGTEDHYKSGWEEKNAR